MLLLLLSCCRYAVVVAVVVVVVVVTTLYLSPYLPGYGRRVQSQRVANFVSRRKWMRQLTLAKNPENESPRSSPEPSEAAAEKRRGSGFGLEDSGKDEPTYTWRSNYTTGRKTGQESLNLNRATPH